MHRQARIDILNRILHGTVNSVVQYIDIATPYVPEGFDEKMAALRRMRDEEVRTAQALTDMIATLDGVPSVGVFPYWNVDLNYLDVRFLAQFAKEHQQKVIDELEADLDAVRDDPRVHGLLSKVLKEKRAHQETLEEIGVMPEPPTAEEAKAAQPAESQHAPRPSADRFKK